ncbi:MAG: hypothetical protein KDE27_17675 [Planctomycetes bacterium]|nr:hypothetical protein [Planctomycetota bacterium]
MKRANLGFGIACALLPGCSFVGATAEIGLVQMTLSGDAALASAQGGVPPSSFQDVDGALGVGSELYSPILRGQLDLGSLVVTGSAFVLDESGSGTLAATFGPIAAGTPVQTEFEFANAKLSLTYDIGLGPVKLSPGLALDVIDFRLAARETTFGNSGQIDELLPLPMLFLRAEGDIGVVAVVGEAGYLDVPEIDGAAVRLLDLEGMVEVRVFPTLQLFAGYRLIDIDGKGETSDTSFALDAALDGWVVGGGIRF